MYVHTPSFNEGTNILRDFRCWRKCFAGGCSKFFYAIFLTAATFLAGIPQRCVLFLFISSFYFGVDFINPHNIVINAADITFLLLVLAFFSFLLNRLDYSPKITNRPKKVLGWVLLFTIWCSISVIVNLFSSTLHTGLHSIWFAIRLAELPVGLYIFSSKGVNRYREPIFDFIIFYSILEIGLSLFQHFLLHRVTSHGTFPNHHAIVGIMMAPSAAISLYRYLIRNTLLPRIFYGAVFFLSIYTIILSQCRSMLVGVAIAIVIFFLTNIKFKMRYFIFLACTISAIAISIKVTPLEHIFYKTIHPSNSPTSVDISSYGRLLIWEGAITHFIHASLFEKLVGVGTGSFFTVRYNFFIFSEKYAGGGHNNFLQALIETGIIGLILFIIMFYSICRALLRSSKTDALAMPFFYATIALLASGFTQETFWVQDQFNGGFWLLNMIIVGLILGNQHNDLF
jgi:O-antigen ligase